MQSDSWNKSGGFSYVYRPDDDDLYIAIINTGKVQMSFLVEYFQSDCNVRLEDRLMIKPFETKLYYISSDKLIVDRQVDIKWTTNGRRSIYIICSSKAHDSFSIDHAN